MVREYSYGEKGHIRDFALEIDLNQANQCPVGLYDDYEELDFYHYMREHEGVSPEEAFEAMCAPRAPKRNRSQRSDPADQTHKRP